jgi:hypothetical protein
MAAARNLVGCQLGGATLVRGAARVIGPVVFHIFAPHGTNTSR